MLRNNLTGWIVRRAGLALLLAMGQPVVADQAVTRLTQSVEGPVASGSVISSQQLDQARVDAYATLEVAGSRLRATAQRSLPAHAAGQTFSIFDAQTVISRDDDADGYYHRLKVSFDADFSGGLAWVYAKLYLSLEGGPWNHYFTTDSFPIEADSSEDDYEVVTRLLDGYPSGYYDVLIELYDEDEALLVVNYGPYEDRDLSVLPLEDSYRDSDDGHGGGGAFGLGILLLGLFVLGRRYFTGSSTDRLGRSHK
ncbi:MAG: choice-of-anchor H family protein [Candidatus Thiodiazotropha sp. (ex Dulcina madagascariensis)]|nr:choice-of-anchor H family protein [Candidatus Thiodiazotropha sp. (ex Dulcina madagascariensis)]